MQVEGAFLVSAKRENGKLSEISILSEKGGTTRLKVPYEQWEVKSASQIEVAAAEPGFIELSCQPGGTLGLLAR